MKIKEIKGKRKHRDYGICRYWMDGEKTIEQIAKRFRVSVSTVNRAVYRNRGVLNFDTNYEKARRVRWYKKSIHKANDTKKDPADLQDKLRVEFEGDKATINIDNSIHITEEKRDKYRDSITRLLGHRQGAENSLEVCNN